jgi:hypothetical protein
MRLAEFETAQEMDSVWQAIPNKTDKSMKFTYIFKVIHIFGIALLSVVLGWRLRHWTQSRTIFLDLG